MAGGAHCRKAARPGSFRAIPGQRVVGWSLARPVPGACAGDRRGSGAGRAERRRRAFSS